jgi:hypothetical protein
MPLTLQQIDGLSFCAASRAAEHIMKLNADAAAREIESCMAWHAIAAKIRTQN